MADSNFIAPDVARGSTCLVESVVWKFLTDRVAHGA